MCAVYNRSAGARRTKPTPRRAPSPSRDPSTAKANRSPARFRCALGDCRFSIDTRCRTLTPVHFEQEGVGPDQLFVPANGGVNLENLYPVSFVIAIAWVGIFSGMMVDWATSIGCVVGIPDAVVRCLPLPPPPPRFSPFAHSSLQQTDSASCDSDGPDVSGGGHKRPGSADQCGRCQARPRRHGEQRRSLRDAPHALRANGSCLLCRRCPPRSAATSSMC